MCAQTALPPPAQKDASPPPAVSFSKAQASMGRMQFSLPPVPSQFLLRKVDLL